MTQYMICPEERKVFWGEGSADQCWVAKQYVENASVARWKPINETWARTNEECERLLKKWVEDMRKEKEMQEKKKPTFYYLDIP
jgi:hypothetical protein